MEQQQPLLQPGAADDDAGENQPVADNREAELIDLCPDEWGFEADSCCGCCDLQVGAKVIAIMGVVQGLTNCMSISTAGFLAAPTLLIGCLSVCFGMYGFWGAQKCDQRKIRIHFYWLIAVSFLLVMVSIGRIYTSESFCESHNCIIDHMWHPGRYDAYGNRVNKIAAANGFGPNERNLVPADKAVMAEVGMSPGAQTRRLLKAEHHSSSVSKHHKHAHESRVGARSEEGSLHKHGYSESRHGYPDQAIPIYREPCYVEDGHPSLSVCVKAHKLSALTTMCVTVPLNIYFAFIIRSLYRKVRRGELPNRPPLRPVARPIQIGQPVPPMAVYEAKDLSGSPQSGTYFDSSNDPDDKPLGPPLDYPYPQDPAAGDGSTQDQL